MSNTRFIISAGSDEEVLSFLGLNNISEDVRVVTDFGSATILNKLYVVRSKCSCFVVYNDVYHNPYGPSLVLWYMDKSKTIYYHLYGNLHRLNKPAQIIYNEDGLIVKECYYLNHKLHNPTGPAFREYRHNKWNNYYYKHGVSISKENFLNMVHI